MNQDIFKDMTPEMIAVFKGSMITAYFLIGIVFALYVRNLYQLVKLISPANRHLQPSTVLFLFVSFLNIVGLVPLFIQQKIAAQYEMIFTGILFGIKTFMLIFTFYMIHKLSESLGAEIKGKNLQDDPKPTLNIGLFMCICNTVGLLAGVGYLAIIGIFGSLAGIAAWIMYWVKTNEYKNKLRSLPPTSSLSDLGIH